MKKKNIFLGLILIIALLAGCGAKDEVAEDMKTESDAMQDYVDEEFAPSEDVVMGGTTSSKAEVSANRKIIERMYLDAETKDFDNLIEKLTKEVEAVGGYIESSSVSGNRYGYDDSRYAEFVFRIPTGKEQAFFDFVADNGTVINKRIETDDVTLSYIDTESRVKALETEKESLEKLLEQSGSLEEIIQIRDRLTDVIYEIESHQSQLRLYDNLIEYTTMTVSIREVEKETIIEEQTAWEQIGTNLSDNIDKLKDGVIELFVFLVSNIPFIVIFGGVLAIGILIVKRVKNRKIRKQDE